MPDDELVEIRGRIYIKRGSQLIDPLIARERALEIKLYDSKLREVNIARAKRGEEPLKQIPEGLSQWKGIVDA